ncbi:FAD-dependent monooxygenase [Cellulomonas sp.]|uniref:FAD-dependent monooxygenase n=1 Tax=Cellulomonas sp. TaxID=40001 RepID=UPI003BAC28DD
MPRQPPRVLISGASVAGPTAAYWLSRHGYAVTVVERMPLDRVRTSGHAVDLFGPAVDVADWMGVLPAVTDRRTRTETLSFQRDGGRGVDVQLHDMVAGISGKHVEIMRGELASILYEATRSDVEYVFEDSIQSIREQPDAVAVTFERAPADRFDLVIGADGLHSVVRHAVFGPEDQFRRFLGGYLAFAAIPNYLDLRGRMVVWNAPGRAALIYPVHGTTAARAGFLFRRSEELPLDHRDADGQKRLLRHLYGRDGGEVPRLLAETDAADDFYFDSISQIVMDRWTRGRVTLVGDAGYSPGPAVGGGTSIAMIGAYVLAQELARAGREYQAGLRAYEDHMHDVATRARGIGPSIMSTLIPRTRLQVRLIPELIRLVTRLPPSVQRRVVQMQATPARALESVHLIGPGAE